MKPLKNANSTENMLKKLLIIGLATSYLIILVPITSAQSLLPFANKNYQDCENKMKKLNNLKQNLAKAFERNEILGCAVITGRIHLYMIPYFIIYFIEILVEFAGVLCILFIVFGGLQYALGGISDTKEKGKKTVMNAIIGLIVTTLAWIVINIIQVAVTSPDQSNAQVTQPVASSSVTLIKKSLAWKDKNDHRH